MIEIKLKEFEQNELRYLGRLIRHDLEKTKINTSDYKMKRIILDKVELTFKS